MVPYRSTEWVQELLFSQKAIAPSFAPTFLEGTRSLGPEGRRRMSNNLLSIRSLCTEDFAYHEDYFKVFDCSWRDGPRHVCPVRLYVVGCTRHLVTGQEKVHLQCVYTEGCQHHLDDKGRGKARARTIKLAPGMTPNGICRDVVKNIHPQALWTCN